MRKYGKQVITGIISFAEKRTAGTEDYDCSPDNGCLDHGTYFISFFNENIEYLINSVEII